MVSTRRAENPGSDSAKRNAHTVRERREGVILTWGNFLCRTLVIGEVWPVMSRATFFAADPADRVPTSGITFCGPKQGSVGTTGA